jgi:hypothetical protein
MTKEEKYLALFAEYSTETLKERISAALRYIQNYRSLARSLRRDKAEYIAEHERNGRPVKRSTVYDFDAEIHYAEAEVRGAREALALYRRAQELQAIHGRRDNDNMYSITL